MKNVVKNDLVRVMALTVGAAALGGAIISYQIHEREIEKRRGDEAEVGRLNGLPRVPSDAVITTTIITDFAEVVLPRRQILQKSFAEYAGCHSEDSGKLRSAIVGGENGKGWREVAVLCP